MISLILFIYSIYCFEIKRDKVSFYLILQFMALKAYSMLSWDNGPLRFDDYALLMILYSYLREGVYQKITPSLAKIIYAYLVVVLLSAIISYLYYQIPIVQIFKAVRLSFFVLIIFDLIKITNEEYHILFYKIFVLSSFAAIIYCLTVITGKIPEGASGGTGYLGLPRSFNYPPLIAFNCLYIFFIFDKKNKWFIPLLALSFITLLFIQSRGMLVAILLTLVIGITLKSNKSNRILIFSITICAALFLISNLIFSGETGTKTMNDLSKISSGEFTQNNFEVEDDATLSYRLNILAVSVIKTVTDPIRFFFGSGLFVGMPLSFFERWNTIECSFWDKTTDTYSYITPDISYSNIIYNIGFCGLIIHIYMIYTMCKLILKRANGDNNYEIVGAMYFLYMIIISINSSHMTWPNYLVVPFFFLQYVERKYNINIRIMKLILILYFFAKINPSFYKPNITNKYNLI